MGQVFSSSEGSLAVVGMDVIAGGWDGLAAFLRGVYGGARAVRISPALLEEIASAEGFSPAGTLLRRTIRRALAELPVEALTGLCLFSEGCAAGEADPGSQ